MSECTKLNMAGRGLTSLSNYKRSVRVDVPTGLDLINSDLPIKLFIAGLTFAMKRCPVTVPAGVNEGEKASNVSVRIYYNRTNQLAAKATSKFSARKLEMLRRQGKTPLFDEVLSWAGYENYAYNKWLQSEKRQLAPLKAKREKAERMLSEKKKQRLHTSRESRNYAQAKTINAPSEKRATRKAVQPRPTVATTKRSTSTESNQDTDTPASLLFIGFIAYLAVAGVLCAAHD